MRYLVVAVGLLFVVGALAATKAAQIGTLVAFAKEAEQMGPPPEAVGSAVAEEQSWEEILSAVGTVASSASVSLSNEVPGVVTRIGFESGEKARAGQVLVELDSRVERAELESALASEKYARRQEARTRALYRSGAVARAALDASQSELKVASARVTELRAQIARKIVRAPFAGKLGIRAVNLGQYLSPGTAITVLDTTTAAFVDFTLPQDEIEEVTLGMPVRIEADGRQLVASIAAIEPTVDPVTRAAPLRAIVAGDDGQLRPGMFVDVAVVLPEQAAVVVVPRTAVVHASYGDSVYVIEDKKADEPGMRRTPDGRPVKAARQRFVRTGEQRGDFIAVLEGLEPGEVVVSAGAFKLRNNTPIVINDKGVPRPELTPEPENR